ncbi:DinB family protein [Flavobacterium sufflavum]|uniref:DinB family protein n=1 Tax=Flavobacterium sufflavum TaxID=1921138 RepID=A0A437KTD5_9FLAO|nr:DinB family protein [Flavobacterium sufflavum]RVT75390.1 DinB family protein [Flavobacterium sufflavum]
MNKEEIINHLNTVHLSFWETANKLSNVTITADDKWSVEQNTDHLNKVLFRLNSFLEMPKDTIKLNFGLSNRNSITFKSLIKVYEMALKNGVKSTAPFLPDSSLNISELIKQGKSILSTLILNMQNWEETDLDLYNCPHPALGEITVREVLFFTIYHAQHHEKMIKKYTYELY